MRSRDRWVVRVVLFVPVVRVPTGFVRACLSAYWTSLSSYGFALFVHVCPGGRWVRTSLSALSGYALEVVGFLQVHLVGPVAPLWSLGSYGLVWYVPRGRWLVRACLVRPGRPGAP